MTIALPASDGVRFPNRIAHVRDVMRIKVTQLARIVGINRNHLALVEAGKKVPSAVIIHDVAEALGVPVGDLFDEDWSAARRTRIRAARALEQDR